MKNRKRVICIILVVGILAGALATAFLCMPQNNANHESDVSDEKKEVDTLGNSADNIQAIEQGGHRSDTQSEDAELELDIEKIERDTDPVLISSKIEYGKKEADNK